PMVKQAKEMIKEGILGKVRKVYVEYPQGWLSAPLEKDGNKQAEWRTDPKKSGVAGSMGDIGTHAANLVEYVTGINISAVCANINRVVVGRELDDDGDVRVKVKNGASGVLMAYQIATGEENCLKIRIYGEKGGVEWKQDDANSLIVKHPDKATQILRTGGPK